MSAPPTLTVLSLGGGVQSGGRTCSPRPWRSTPGCGAGWTPYLHMLRMPLAEAVALDEADLGADGQRDGFGNECEGHCGGVGTIPCCLMP